MLQATRFKQAVTENTLRSCQIFAGLPPPDTGTLAEMAVAKHLEKGQYLFRAGESVQGFYVMQKGRGQRAPRQRLGERAGDTRLPSG